MSPIWRHRPPSSWTRDEMAALAARELKDSDWVDVGLGSPTLEPNIPVHDRGYARTGRDRCGKDLRDRHPHVDIEVLRTSWQEQTDVVDRGMAQGRE